MPSTRLELIRIRINQIGNVARPLTADETDELERLVLCLWRLDQEKSRTFAMRHPIRGRGFCMT